MCASENNLTSRYFMLNSRLYRKEYTLRPSEAQNQESGIRLMSSRPSLVQIEKNFADIHPPLTPSQALEAGSRCLFCYDAPCIKACPTGIEIPEFIRRIITGNLEGSAKTILSANVLGHSCGRICPTAVLCEGACVLNAEGKQPVEIGRLQRYAVDHVLNNNITVLHAGKETGKKVALIGAGPASLACAAELRQHGIAATIFDSNPEPGGLNTYGIAAYKMRANESVRETEMIRRLGVEFRNGVTVGGSGKNDVSLAQIEKDFDAIFLGIGLGATDALGIPGEELPGVVDALTFIRNTKTMPLDKIPVGKRVACIGGGNTAIDVVTAAKRLGAEQVYMVYRRGRDEMSAFEFEYDLALQDAVTFVWNAAPVRVISLDPVGMGKVDALECVRTELGPDKPGEKAKLTNIAGSEFRLDVDMVVKALGQQKLTSFLNSISGLELDKSGRIVIDKATGQSSNKKYFAGGDCAYGAGEVVDAVAHGKKAALGITKMLGV